MKKLLTFVILCIALPIFSQETVEIESKVKDPLFFFPKLNSEHTFPNRFWVDLSFQLGFLGDYIPPRTENNDGPAYFGVGGGLNLHYLTKNRRHLQLRVNYLESNSIASGDQMRILDNGLLFGWVFARKYVLMEVATGISCVPGYKRGATGSVGLLGTSYTKDYFVTVGIPFEADMKFMYKKYAGIGLVFKANLNPELSYGTLGVELTLGGPN